MVWNRTVNIFCCKKRYSFFIGVFFQTRIVQKMFWYFGSRCELFAKADLFFQIRFSFVKNRIVRTLIFQVLIKAVSWNLVNQTVNIHLFYKRIRPSNLAYLRFSRNTRFCSKPWIQELLSKCVNFKRVGPLTVNNKFATSGHGDCLRMLCAPARGLKILMKHVMWPYTYTQI